MMGRVNHPSHQERLKDQAGFLQNEVRGEKRKGVQTRTPQILRISRIFWVFRGIRSIREVRVKNYRFDFTTI